VSCWCCPLQGLEELRTLRREFPELWEQLLEWEAQTLSGLGHHAFGAAITGETE
jgi:hypothetical protein